jgi:hypothetical protein
LAKTGDFLSFLKKKRKKHKKGKLENSAPEASPREPKSRKFGKNSRFVTKMTPLEIPRGAPDPTGFKTNAFGAFFGKGTFSGY